MLLPEREAQKAVGRLMRVQQATGCSIKVSAADELVPLTRERIATIQGSLPAMAQAQKLLGAAMAGKGDGESLDADAPRAMNLLLPHNAVGVIIGKGGVQIAQLKEQSGANVRVSQPKEMIEQTQERIVHLTGTAAQVDSAQEKISALIAAAPPSQQPVSCDYEALKGVPARRRRRRRQDMEARRRAAAAAARATAATAGYGGRGGGDYGGRGGGFGPGPPATAEDRRRQARRGWRPRRRRLRAAAAAARAGGAAAARAAAARAGGAAGRRAVRPVRRRARCTSP